MNVISWENGDTTITDYPPCVARPLARLVQAVNDTICHHRVGDMLCPECSMMVLDLAHRTVGTFLSTHEQRAAWLSELLASPEWGIIRYVDASRWPAIQLLADLYLRRAGGEEPSWPEWLQAIQANANAYAAYGVNVNAATAAAYANTYAAAYGVNANAARLRHANYAIDAWHRICGTTPQEVDQIATACAVDKMLAKGVV
jgi:hypothetical protein